MSSSSSQQQQHQTAELEENKFATSSGAGPAQSTSAAAVNKFMGHKERRKSSAVKMFLGDYLSLATNQAILKIMSKNGTVTHEKLVAYNIVFDITNVGDTGIVFSDIIIKINKRNKMQERILLITSMFYIINYNIFSHLNKINRFTISILMATRLNEGLH
jgi:hypothetical protein